MIPAMNFQPFRSYYVFYKTISISGMKHTTVSSPDCIPIRTTIFREQEIEIST